MCQSDETRAVTIETAGEEWLHQRWQVVIEWPV